MKISVIMPNYDCGDFLAEAVGSLERQKGVLPGRDFELILADDGSRDARTLAILADLEKLEWCRIVRTGGRRGAAHARNLAARSARGEWLAFLDSDDLWSDDSLAVRWDARMRFPDADCIATDYREFVSRSDIEQSGPGEIEQNTRRRAPVAKAFDSGQAIRLERPIRSFIGAMPICTITVLLRRSVFDEQGGFDEQLPRAEDLHLWLRISANSDIVFVPAVTAYYRNRPGSLTFDHVLLMRQTAQCYKSLLNSSLPESVHGALRACIAEAHRNESYAARVVRDRLAATTAAARSIYWGPLEADNWSFLVRSIFPARIPA